MVDRMVHRFVRRLSSLLSHSELFRVVLPSRWKGVNGALRPEGGSDQRWTSCDRDAAASISPVRATSVRLRQLRWDRGQDFRRETRHLRDIGADSPAGGAGTCLESPRGGPRAEDNGETNKTTLTVSQRLSIDDSPVFFDGSPLIGTRLHISFLTIVCCRQDRWLVRNEHGSRRIRNDELWTQRMLQASTREKWFLDWRFHGVPCGTRSIRRFESLWRLKTSGLIRTAKSVYLWIAKQSDNFKGLTKNTIEEGTRTTMKSRCILNESKERNANP